MEVWEGERLGHQLPIRASSGNTAAAGAGMLSSCAQASWLGVVCEAVADVWVHRPGAQHGAAGLHWCIPLCL